MIIIEPRSRAGSSLPQVILFMVDFAFCPWNSSHSGISKHSVRTRTELICAWGQKLLTGESSEVTAAEYFAARQDWAQRMWKKWLGGRRGRGDGEGEAKEIRFHFTKTRLIQQILCGVEAKEFRFNCTKTRLIPQVVCCVNTWSADVLMMSLA